MTDRRGGAREGRVIVRLNMPDDADGWIWAEAARWAAARVRRGPEGDAFASVGIDGQPEIGQLQAVWSPGGKVLSVYYTGASGAACHYPCRAQTGGRHDPDVR